MKMKHTTISKLGIFLGLFCALLVVASALHFPKPTPIGDLNADSQQYLDYKHSINNDTRYDIEVLEVKTGKYLARVKFIDSKGEILYLLTPKENVIP